MHDPSVQDAAVHALKSIQQRSNSLFPYELQEVVHANAEVSSFCSFINFILPVCYLLGLNWDMAFLTVVSVQCGPCFRLYLHVEREP